MRVAITLLSVLLSILLFAFVCVTIASAFLSPAVIKDAITEIDIAELLGETSVSLRDTIDLIYFERIDSSSLSNDKIKTFLQLDSVKAELYGAMEQYIDAISTGDIGYHITKTDMAAIWETLEPDLNTVLDRYLTEDDYTYLSNKSSYEFGAYNTGRILYDAGIDHSIPYYVLSDYPAIILGIICVLIIFNIFMLHRIRIPAALLYTGIPVLLAGILYSGAGLLLGPLSHILVNRGLSAVT